MSRNRYVTRAVERSVIVDSLLQGIDGIGVSKELFEQLISQADSNFLELKASEIARKNTSDRVSLSWQGHDCFFNYLVHAKRSANSRMV